MKSRIEASYDNDTKRLDMEIQGSAADVLALSVSIARTLTENFKMSLEEYYELLQFKAMGYDDEEVDKEQREAIRQLINDLARRQKNE